MIMCLIDRGTNGTFFGMVMINFVLMMVGGKDLMNEFVYKSFIPMR